MKKKIVFAAVLLLALFLIFSPYAPHIAWAFKFIYLIITNQPIKP